MDSNEALARIGKGLKSIPDLGKLLFRLSRDPRVPRRQKLIFAGVALYLAVPFDIVPDWLPGIGHLDDLVLIAIALDAMVNRVPEEIIAEHWDGEKEALDTIREILEIATSFVPERVRRRLFGDNPEP